MARIAIAGAGMAGLSALNVLAGAGHSVTVFDKSRGSGGRLATKKMNTASWDMGAQFIKAHTPEFAAALHEWESAGWIMPWNITPWVIDSTTEYPSPDAETRYVAVPRMTALSRHLLAPAHQFITETRIETCHRRHQHWYLTATNGSEFGPFDGLVIAVPPQQAQPLLTESTTLANACSAEMLPCWTLLLALKNTLDTPYDAAFVHDSPIAWIARNSSKPQRAPLDTWVIQANHEWSKQHCDDSRNRVQTSLLRTFEHLTNSLPDQASTQWLHRWLYAVPAQASTVGFLSDLPQSLVVCGDWLKSSNVEGAWLSGREGAHALNNRF